MMERLKRMTRLMELRRKQHDRAVTDLLAARTVLYTAAELIGQNMENARIARLHRDTALVEAKVENWLLACADESIAAVHSLHRLNRRIEAEKAVAAAEEREVEARRELRQMEQTVTRLRQGEMLLSSRKEQQRLDEYAQLLRIRSSKRSLALEQA